MDFVGTGRGQLEVLSRRMYRIMLDEVSFNVYIY
jgi:hypothetical protein